MTPCILPDAAGRGDGDAARRRRARITVFVDALRTRARGCERGAARRIPRAIPRPRHSAAAPRGPDIALLLVEQRDELVDHFVADVHGARRKGEGRGGLSAGAHFQRDRSGPAVLFRRELGHVLQHTDFTQGAGDAIQRSASLT